MSKAKPTSNQKKITNKKVVVTTTQTKKLVREKTSLNPTRSRRKSVANAATLAKEPLLFGRQNYILMGIGLAIITLGLILMSGGAMPSPDVWDEDIIYSFRRTVLAPFLMIVGLIVEVVAIFKK